MVRRRVRRYANADCDSSRGKYEDALDLTQQAFTINSHEPITNYLLGNLLALTKNNHTAAQEYYRRTLAIDPTHIYARRQLRLSYCHIMHTAWDVMGCTDNKDHCDEQNIRAASMKCNLLYSHQHYKVYDTTSAFASTDSSCDDRSNQCMLYFSLSLVGGFGTKIVLPQVSRLTF